MLTIRGPFADFLGRLNLTETIRNLESQLYQLCVPLELEGHQRYYYTTTTATFLMAFADMGFISKDDLPQFQQALISLRDRCVVNYQITKKKSPEDKPAWCVTEGPSTWATSMALWALISTRYKGDQIGFLREALEWLLRQEKRDLGWGFQNIDSCRSSTFLTSIVVRVFQLALDHGYIEPECKANYERAIQAGLSFLIANASIGEKSAAWAAYPNSNILSPTCTAYAIWILRMCGGRGEQGLTEKGINFIESQLQGEKGWPQDIILDEYETKEGLQKRVISFTPAIVIILLNIGMPHRHPMAVQAIRNILSARGQKGWEIDQRTMYSFSTTLALWTIYRWWKALGLDQAFEALGREDEYKIVKSRFYYVNRKQLLVLLIIAYAFINAIYLSLMILLFGKSVWDYICDPGISDLLDFVLSVGALLAIPAMIFYLLRTFYTCGQIQPTTFINLIKQKIKSLNLFRSHNDKEVRNV